MKKGLSGQQLHHAYPARGAGCHVAVPGRDYGNPSCLHEWGTRRGRRWNGPEPGGRPIGERRKKLSLPAAAPKQQFRRQRPGAGPQNKGKHIVVSAIEHFSVLNSAKTLEKMGFLYCCAGGQVRRGRPGGGAKAIRKDTSLVSIMHANGEVGTIEPIKEIAKITKEKTSSSTPMRWRPPATSRRCERPGGGCPEPGGKHVLRAEGSRRAVGQEGVRIMPLLDGGVQEGGRRAGTENVPAIVGLGKAAELAKAQMSARNAHVITLRDRLINELPAKIDMSWSPATRRTVCPGMPASAWSSSKVSRC